MSSSPPPTKRKRTEADAAESDSTPLPADTVERSAQLWFDDGNVVLQAEATQFRVHRSILSHHSPIMKDCFKFPQPEGVPTVEGCPLVHLPDSAKDIGNLCGLLYGMYHPDVKTVTSSYLETMLLMGRKYEIASLTTAAENVLQQLFPPTLEKWDACRDDLCRVINRNTGFLFDVFNLACEYPLPSIRKPLLVSMCTLHYLTAIMSGVPVRGRPNPAILTPSAKQFCVLGRMMFMQLIFQNFMKLYCRSENEDRESYAIPTSACRSTSRCMDVLRDITTELAMKSATKFIVDFSPPATTQPDPYMEDCLCSACFAHLQKLIGESRHLVWKELPGALENALVH